MHQMIHFQKEEPTLGIWGTSIRLGSVMVSNVLHVPMPQSTVPARPSRLARRGLAAHIRPGLCVTAGLITLQ